MNYKENFPVVICNQPATFNMTFWITRIGCIQLQDESGLQHLSLPTEKIMLIVDQLDFYLLHGAEGRVNLIGEHIDYEGYSVLPMAIRQDTIVAIQKRDAGEAEKLLRIANVNDKYQKCTYPADPDQEIDLKNHRWGHYFICGYKGYHEYAKLKGINVGAPVGLDILVDGTVPTWSGLSSSAAFVCSSTIAIMAHRNSLVEWIRKEKREFNLTASMLYTHSTPLGFILFSVFEFLNIDLGFPETAPSTAAAIARFGFSRFLASVLIFLDRLLFCFKLKVELSDNTYDFCFILDLGS